MGGAGQLRAQAEKQDRAAGLYAADRAAPFKRAEKNPVVLDFLNEYTPEERHELLHVSYTD